MTMAAQDTVGSLPRASGTNLASIILQTTPLATTVVGSYSVPEWLGRLKTDYHQRRISAQHLNEIHDVAIKAALKDQELAGVDIVSDGELRRDNDIDYLLARIPGVQIPRRSKTDYYDYYEARVSAPLPEASPLRPGLAADFTFTREHTQRPVKFSFTGPFSLSRRIRDTAGAGERGWAQSGGGRGARGWEEQSAGAGEMEPGGGKDGAYADPADLVRALARWLNAQARELAAAGADLLQIDEPFLAGYPEQVDLAIEAVNIVTAGVPATWALHVCYGNRYARPLWEGHYDFLFPAVASARVDALVLEFARKGLDDLRLLRQYAWDRYLGLGVIDVKTAEVEPPGLVASRIRRALEFVPAQRLMVNPDCGLRHLPAAVAQAKLRAMVAGAAQARAELGLAPAQDAGI
jgi:5-methyltetrahydropteroyltriglutamate--homocysteine methyltransferase